VRTDLHHWPAATPIHSFVKKVSMEKTLSYNESMSLTGEELVTLMQKEKGKICISIIVPSHKLSPERRVDRLEVERAVLQAKEELQHSYREEEISQLQQSLDELVSQIDFNHNTPGIGLFVSSFVSQLVHFFFSVKEKVVIGPSFEIRDILYQTNYARRYFTLMLSEKEARLFEGRFDHLHEITDHHFPKKYVDDYIYASPARDTSSVGNAYVRVIERDKSQLEEIRYQHFAAEVGEILKDYLMNDTPLILAGAKKDLSYFKSATHNRLHGIGEIPGNYFHTGVKELGDLSWELLRPYLDQATQKRVGEFKEKIGQGLAVTGMPEIWKAAGEGRGLELLVEKDFSQPGFLINTDPGHLHLSPPKEPHRILADAVDDLMECVLEKNGQVTFLENDSFRDYQRIALITRY
jgi:hypothetical protein